MAIILSIDTKDRKSGEGIVRWVTSLGSRSLSRTRSLGIFKEDACIEEWDQFSPFEVVKRGRLPTIGRYSALVAPVGSRRRTRPAVEYLPLLIQSKTCKRTENQFGSVVASLAMNGDFMEGFQDFCNTSTFRTCSIISTVPIYLFAHP